MSCNICYMSFIPFLILISYSLGHRFDYDTPIAGTACLYSLFSIGTWNDDVADYEEAESDNDSSLPELVREDKIEVHELAWRQWLVDPPIHKVCKLLFTLHMKMMK